MWWGKQQKQWVVVVLFWAATEHAKSVQMRVACLTSHDWPSSGSLSAETHKNVCKRTHTQTCFPFVCVHVCVCGMGGTKILLWVKTTTSLQNSWFSASEPFSPLKRKREGGERYSKWMDGLDCKETKNRSKAQSDTPPAHDRLRLPWDWLYLILCGFFPERREVQLFFNLFD